MKKIVIVGGGIAGLSAGIYAQKVGFQSEIYEKHNILGGQCTGWYRKGFFIDNCIHWLTGTKKGTSLYELWQEVGALGDNVELIQADKFYTVEKNNEKISLWKDISRTEQEMLALSPKDEVEIRKFIKYVKLAKSMEMPVDKPMDMMRPWEYISMGMKMSGMAKVLKEYGKISIKELSDRFKHPLLKSLIKDYMLEEYVAFSLLVSYATFASGNGAIPKGGSLEMVKRMQNKYEKIGGIVHTGKDVAKVKINNNKAEGIILADDSFTESDYVICTCDTHFTFNSLLDRKYMEPKLKKAYENRKDNPVTSGFQIAFAIESDCSEVDGSLIFDCEPLKVGTSVVHGIGIKSYDYEPSFSPKGKTILQVNFLQLEKDFEYWRNLYQNRTKYQEEKKRLVNEVLERIVEHFPKLCGKIEVLDCWTPVTYGRYCNAYCGAYMSFAMTKNSNNQRFSGIIKGLDNVVIASQWLQSPGGLPTAAVMGKFAIQRILKKEKKPYKI